MTYPCHVDPYVPATVALEQCGSPMDIRRSVSNCTVCPIGLWVGMDRISLPLSTMTLAIAWIHLGLQDVESCLDWLEKAVAEREPQIIHFPVKPMYDGLRAHPRVQALIASMRLTPA